MTNRQRLIQIFQDTFDLEEIKVTNKTSMESLEDWDSLAHISLILNIETEFGIKIPMEQVPKLNNFGEILKEIENKK